MAGAEPAVKPEAATVAVQPALASARLSVTVMLPRLPLAMAPGAAGLSVALAGTVIDSSPVTTGMVTAQRGSVLPAGQLLPAVVEVTVLTIDLSPVAGLLTVTE